MAPASAVQARAAVILCNGPRGDYCAAAIFGASRVVHSTKRR